MTPERWGILGGIFDPVHYAHLAIAEQTADALELDRVVFVPANVPVHRSPAVASAEDRLAMVGLATAENPQAQRHPPATKGRARAAISPTGSVKLGLAWRVRASHHPVNAPRFNVWEWPSHSAQSVCSGGISRCSRSVMM